MPVALICGVGGQDGALLSKLLVAKGYEVHGTSRDVDARSFRNLTQLGLVGIQLHSMIPQDYRSVVNTLSDVLPDEIYFLAGQTSVGRSFALPVETIDSIYLGTLNILEGMRFVVPDAKLFHAGSSECYGECKDIAFTENSAFRPRSPYAIAKASAVWLVDTYSDSYGLKACSGMLFNHESSLRPDRFVTQKVIRAAIEISQGKSHELVVGNTQIVRDWGAAEEYVNAMWMMLNAESLSNYIIARGHSYSLKEFIEKSFDHFGIAYDQYVREDPSLYRPNEILVSKGNPEKIELDLGWKAEKTLDDIIGQMIKQQLG